MRLQCDVEVVSRLLPTCGLRGRGRGSRALLSLGRQPGRARGGVYLMVCTARDRAGVRYQVQDNVERFFTRFVEEGKATVRLKEPAVDVCLSKNPVQLSAAAFPPLQRSGSGQDLPVRERLPEQLHSADGDHEPAPRGSHRGPGGQ
uniref:Leucine rich repeat protein 1 n=1 Tax=Phasianus colchicus TaxID=9054 RepID=A0A669PWH1_PHACC